MANFFDPGSTPVTTTGTTTPSPADQATQQFKVQMLGRLLSSMAGGAPSFAQFAGGAAPSNVMSAFGGSGGDIAGLLGAMGQPGAFTAKATKTGSEATPSQFSDLTQMGVLGALIAQTLGINPLSGLKSILSGVGGDISNWLNPSSSTTPSPDFSQSLSGGDIPGVNFTPDTSAMTSSIDPTVMSQLQDLGLIY